MDLDIDKGNFSRIHNLLLEAIAGAPITDRERRVMIAVARLTYGYGRAKTVLDLFQVVRITRMHMPHVKTAIAKLLEVHLLVQEGEEIGIQKYFDRWDVEVRSRGRVGGRKNQAPSGSQLSLFDGDANQFDSPPINLIDANQIDCDPINLIDPQSTCLASIKPDNKLYNKLIDPEVEGWLPAPFPEPLKKEKKKKMIMQEHEEHDPSRAHEEPELNGENISNASQQIDGFPAFMAIYQQHSKRAIASARDISSLKSTMSALQIDGNTALSYLERWLSDRKKRGASTEIPHPNYVLPIFQGYAADDVRSDQKGHTTRVKSTATRSARQKRYAGYF